jgi:ribosomal protein S18 acetylase RimI-like enzyme
VTVSFRTGQATRGEILAHLRACDATFEPVLSGRVDLDDYAEKLSRKAITFEAWEGDVLVGLVAGYFNDLTTREGFITTVSTHPGFTGRGSASALLAMALRYAADHGFEALSLDVGEHNQSAQNLYRKWGFERIGISEGMIRMTCRTLDRQS